MSVRGHLVTITKMAANPNLWLFDKVFQAFPYNVGRKMIPKTTNILGYIAQKPIFKHLHSFPSHFLSKCSFDHCGPA